MSAVRGILALVMAGCAGSVLAVLLEFLVFRSLSFVDAMAALCLAFGGILLPGGVLVLEARV